MKSSVSLSVLAVIGIASRSFGFVLPSTTTRTTTDGAAQCRTSSSALSAGIPTVQDWKVLKNGAVQGQVKNHPTIPNGDIITTSPLTADPDSLRDNSIVVTKSGSKYRLGKSMTVAAPPKKNGAKAPPTRNGVAAPKVTKTTTKPVITTMPETTAEKMNKAKKEYNLNGKTIGNGKYLLVGNLIRSTSMRSQIYYAYKADALGLPTGPRLTVKISTNLESLERENANYNKVTKNALFPGQFVKKLEFLPEAQGSRGITSKACALVLESGERNLRGLLDARQNQGLSGKAMRQAAVAMAQCIQSMHASGLVWTDLKAENFVVTSNSLGENNGGIEGIKGIDLESAVPVAGPPEDYSPEACPPEFARELAAGRGPDFMLEYNYDTWSFGMLLYEMSVGRSYFGKKSDGAITKVLQDKGFTVEISAVEDNLLRDLIGQCLQLDPQKRPSLTQILLHPYFLTTGFGPISF